MPHRDDTPIGAPCWIDLYTTDPAASRTFYGEMFGWASEEAGPEYGGYINFTKDGEPVGGGMRNDGAAGMPDVWSVYLRTDDATKTAETAEANGAQVFIAPMVVGDVGTMAMIADPGGAAIGFWQPDTFCGFTLVNEPGTPAWFELLTRDYDTAIGFYRDVFRWPVHTMGDTPEFRYSVYGDGQTQEAGIMDAAAFLPEGVPAHWSVYFRVEDADAALARAVELGGAVVVPAEDTPYGRLATASDVTGAIFKLVAGPTS
jgi:predicted enzyme related to lactoylglutathione lyase